MPTWTGLTGFFGGGAGGGAATRATIVFGTIAPVPQNVASGVTTPITTTVITADGELAGKTSVFTASLNRFNATDVGFGTYQFLIDGTPVGELFTSSGAGVNTLTFSQQIAIPPGAHAVGLRCTCSSGFGDQETIGAGMIEGLLLPLVPGALSIEGATVSPVPQNVASGATQTVTTTVLAADGGLAGATVVATVSLNRFDASISGFGTYQLLVDAAPIGETFVASGDGLNTLSFMQAFTIPAGVHPVGLRCVCSNGVGDQETIGSGAIDLIVLKS